MFCSSKSLDSQNLHTCVIATRTLLENQKSWNTEIMEKQKTVLLDSAKALAYSKRMESRFKRRVIGPVQPAAALHTYETLLEPQGYVIVSRKFDGLNQILICDRE